MNVNQQIQDTRLQSLVRGIDALAAAIRGSSVTCEEATKNLQSHVDELSVRKECDGDTWHIVIRNRIGDLAFAGCVDSGVADAIASRLQKDAEQT